MEKEEALYLEKKLRDKLADIAYTQTKGKPINAVIFLDTKYRQSMNYHVDYTKTILDINHPFETWLGLNGDISLIHWVPNKGIDNIDVFIKVN